MKKLLLSALILLFSISAIFSASAEGQLPAFPGAEGGGKYSPGARGILSIGGKTEVYHVTNLNSSGEGSFADAVSKPGRIIVFDISGVIELKTTLTVKSSNLTILGQTAPGDGITISGGDIVFDDAVENIIMRYIRVRPTDKNGGEPDGIGGRYNSNIIVDHCSASWGVDELISLYAGPAQNATDEKPVGNHLTVQNTIGAESLRMSNHTKGAHGYGGIWGGTCSSYINNLLAHHDSRSPRMDRQLQVTEVSNNIIYDWGQTNSAYGAEPYATDKTMKNPSRINWVSNYYKAGPATAKKILTRIFDISSPLTSDDPKSQFFFSGNYIEGTGLISDYANNAYVNNYAGAELLEAEIDMGEYSFNKISAEEAYDYILANAGATLPKRDAVDARIINDVKNGTGRLVNNASEVGGLIPVKSETRVFTIPDEWLSTNGLDGKNETDIIESGDFSGYTVIEAYVNYMTEEQSKTPPTNPNIVVQSPAISALSNTIEGLTVDNGEWPVITEGESISYKATAIAVGGNEVTKMELYDGNTLIDTFDGDVIDTQVSLNPGTHYLTSRAYNTRDEQTQSTTSIVYVKASDAPGSYSFTEIREGTYTGYAGKGGASMDEKGVYTIYGSGRITTKVNDNCGFMYKAVKGDFDISAKIEEIPKFENQQVSGLMVRAGLEKDDIMAMIGDGWLKYGENVRVFSRAAKKATASETYFKNANGNTCENSDSASYSVPKYMRIQRSGNTLTFSVSNSGVVWNDGDREPMTVEFENLPETMYVGLATDSANGVSVKESFSVAKFSHLTLNGESDIVLEEGLVPFFDIDFNSAEKPEWYIPNGSEEKNFEGTGLGGNYGNALLFWGETYRRFNPQNNGIVSATADFYTASHSERVDKQAGARFMLNGIDKNGNAVKIKSIYAQHILGFFIDYDETGASPSITPDSENKYELEKWYKVEVELNYNNGKGKYSFKPYTEYNSLTDTYVTGESIFDCEFDFDTNISLAQLHFERRGGYQMYLDNVGLDVKPPLYKENNKIVVDEPGKDADLYIAVYDENGIIINTKTYSVSKGERTEYDIPSGYKVKAFLWDDNYKPLCKSIEL